MYPRPDGFDKAVQDSHRICTKVDILESGQVIYEGLQITDGNVVVDDVAIRRRADITITDPTGTLTPKDFNDLLFPAGNEFRPYRGTYVNGVPQYMSLGIFGINDVKIEDSGQGLHIGIEGMDRSRGVAMAKLPEVHVITAGTLYTTAIRDLILMRYGVLTFFESEEGITTPLMVIKENSDVWEECQKMAASIGCDLYFDADGYCVCSPQHGETDVDQVDWVYREEELDPTVGDTLMRELTTVKSMLMYASRRCDDEGVHNHVICTGETNSVDVPVRGEAKDLDPASPTYYRGKFKPRPRFMASSFITTPEQATAAARRQLIKEAGFYDRLETITIVHPAHEVGDLVAVYRPRSGISGIYVVDKITIPLVHSRGMNLSTRTRKIMVEGE
jgi:hypothetical protein